MASFRNYEEKDGIRKTIGLEIYKENSDHDFLDCRIEFFCNNARLGRKLRDYVAKAVNVRIMQEKDQ